MKQTKFKWLIWTLFIAVITALAVTGWFYAKCDISKWADIFVNLIITVIGAFGGFITALWVEKIIKNNKNTETKKNYIKSLSRDINKIKDNLNSIIQEDATGTITFQELEEDYYHFELPIWEAMVYSGKVDLFNEEAFFEDLCELSAIINTLNNIENNVMNAKLLNTQKSIDPTRRQKLSEIYYKCEKIDKIITNP